MAAFDEIYTHLPGHTVELRDGHLQLRKDPAPPTTGSILLLGTATDGPKNVPVGVDPDTAEKLFGKAANANGRANGSNLMVGFEEAWNKGCRDIRLMRISGDKAKATVGGMKLESPYGGALYNDVKYRTERVMDTTDPTKVNEVKLIITKPEIKKQTYNEPALVFSSLDYPTLALLAQAINEDRLAVGVVRAVVANSDATTLTTSLPAVVVDTALTGGNDGVNLTKAEFFKALDGEKDAQSVRIKDGAFQLLENYSVDGIVPLGVFVDEDPATGVATDNFGYALARACAVISHRNHMTHGYIATTSPDTPDLETVDAHVTTLLAKPLNFFLLGKDGLAVKDPETGKLFDIGGYISVIAGPDIVVRNTRLGTYATNSAASYAGFVSTLKIKQSPMNKSLPATLGLRFTFGNPQLNKLTGARFVTLTSKGDGQTGAPATVAVVDSVTAAQADSDYTRLESFRCVKRAVDVVRQASDPFRGESNEPNNKNAMDSAIDRELLRMKEDGECQGYQYSISASLYDQVLGNSTIELTIVPPFINRSIKTVVGLAATL